MSAKIINLPYSVTRGAFSRKPRRSKNGTPEERAAKAAAGVKDEKPVKPPRRMMTGVDFEGFVRLLEEPEKQPVSYTHLTLPTIYSV